MPRYVRSMKKFAARSLILALVCGSAPVGAVPTLTLREAVDQALQKNPVILKAQEEIRRTRGLVVVARAQRLPQVELSGRTQFEQDTRFDSGSGGGGASSADLALLGIGGGGGGSSSSQLSEESWTVGVRVTQPIFAGEAGWPQTNASPAGSRREALAALDSTIEDIVLAVERQFYQALRQRALIKVSSSKSSSSRANWRIKKSALKPEPRRSSTCCAPKRNSPTLTRRSSARATPTASPWPNSPNSSPPNRPRAPKPRSTFPVPSPAMSRATIWPPASRRLWITAWKSKDWKSVFSLKRSS